MKKKKRLKQPNRFVRKFKMVAFMLVFGVIGVTFLRFSLAEYPNDPLGFIDYCRFENGQTVMYGWAHDGNAPGGQWPSVTINVSGVGSITTYTNIAGFRDQPINDYLRYFNLSTSHTYGFRAAFSGLYKDTNYTVSGTMNNYGAGASQPIGINTSNQVDNQPANGFPNNRIPSACLANRPLPPAPVVSMSINPTSVPYGGSTTVSWNTTNNPTACSNNFGGPTSGSGSFAATNLTTTRSFSVTCSNSGGSHTASRTVSVAAKPAPPPSGGSGGGGSGGGSSTPAPRPTAPIATRPTPSPTPVVTAQPDTEKPTAPSNVWAEFLESSVELMWDASTDNVAIKTYYVERSLDRENWEKLTGDDGIPQSPFTDSTIIFNTTYHYRVWAQDTSGNLSNHAETSVQTGSFEPNAFPDKELVLTSEDNVARVTLPAGALEKEAVCSLGVSNYLAPNVKDHTTISGPYELLCKYTDGTRVTTFGQNVQVAISLPDETKKRFVAILGYIHDSEWRAADTGSDGNFTLDNTNNFAVMGQVKKTPLWIKIVIALLILIAIVVGGLFGLNRLYRYKLSREAAKRRNDYYHKERGF